MIAWLKDQILAWLQRDCIRPGMMVAADISEGCGGDVGVRHCRRCGAVSLSYDDGATHHEWRTPDPNLWRGR